MEDVAAEFTNENEVTGELRGKSDAAGRALLRLSTLYEFWVAMELVGSWKEGVFTRKVCGLCFDKTKLDDEYYSVLLYFMDNSEKPRVVQLVLEEIQPILDEEGKVVKGAPLEMHHIKRAFEMLRKHQEVMHELGVMDIPEEMRLRWHDIRFAGTDHAGENLTLRTR